MFTESTQWSQITEAFAYILVFYVNVLNIASKENKQYYNYVFAIVISNLLCTILMLHDLSINKNTFQCYYFHFIFCCSTTCCNMSQFFFFLLHIKLLTFCFICVCWREVLYLSMGLKDVQGNLYSDLIIRWYFFEIWNIPKACTYKSKEV